jgi:hypothetical protein
LHQRQLDYAKAFPQNGILALVKAPAPENAAQSTAALAQALAQNQNLFPMVGRPDSGDFFERNGLLFKPLPEVRQTIAGLKQSRPLIRQLAADPSLRGAMSALSFAAAGVRAGQTKLDQLACPLSLTEKTLGDLLAGKPATFSWQELLQGRPLQSSCGTFSRSSPCRSTSIRSICRTQSRPRW